MWLQPIVFSITFLHLEHCLIYSSSIPVFKIVLQELYLEIVALSLMLLIHTFGTVDCMTLLTEDRLGLRIDNAFAVCCGAQPNFGILWRQNCFLQFLVLFLHLIRQWQIGWTRLVQWLRTSIHWALYLLVGINFVVHIGLQALLTKSVLTGCHSTQLAEFHLRIANLTGSLIR